MDADGYPRGMSNAKQCVRIGDYLYDIAGRVLKFEKLSSSIDSTFWQQFGRNKIEHTTRNW